MESIVAFIQSHPSLAVFAVFVGGLVSSASPCVLALVPLVIGFVGGYSQGDKGKTLRYTLTFALGLAIMFTFMGAAAGFVGSIVARTGSLFYWLVAAIAVAMGLSLLGLFEIRVPSRLRLQVKSGGLIGAFLMGILFGFASTPCATPVLVIILALAAVEGHILYGTLLLFVYAIGHCALIVTAGLATGFVENFANSRRVAGFSILMKKTSGALILGAGLYLLYLNV